MLTDASGKRMRRDMKICYERKDGHSIFPIDCILIAEGEPSELPEIEVETIRDLMLAGF